MSMGLQAEPQKMSLDIYSIREHHMSYIYIYIYIYIQENTSFQRAMSAGLDVEPQKMNLKYTLVWPANTYDLWNMLSMSVGLQAEPQKIGSWYTAA